MTDMPECFLLRHPRARKQHRCFECRGAILPGEVYERASGIWEGTPDRFKTCAECAQMRSEVKQDKWDPVAFGYLLEWIIESGDEALRARFDANQKRRKDFLTTAPPGATVGHDENEKRGTG